jgi:hypothetical protein
MATKRKPSVLVPTEVRKRDEQGGVYYVNSSIYLIEVIARNQRVYNYEN